MFLAILPVIVSALAHGQTPPFTFIGFHVRMPVSNVEAFLKASGGSFACRAAHALQRECSGAFRLPDQGAPVPINLQLWSVADTVTQISLSTEGEQRVAPRWVLALQGDYGTPKHQVEFGKQQSWQWSRGGQTLLVVERIVQGTNVNTSVTMSTGPLTTTPAAPEAKRPES